MFFRIHSSRKYAAFRQNSRAFSLVEVIVALTIEMVIIYGLTTVFVAARDHLTSVQSQVDTIDSMQTFQNDMESLHRQYPNYVYSTGSSSLHSQNNFSLAVFANSTGSGVIIGVANGSQVIVGNTATYANYTPFYKLIDRSTLLNIQINQSVDPTSIDTTTAHTYAPLHLFRFNFSLLNNATVARFDMTTSSQAYTSYYGSTFLSLGNVVPVSLAQTVYVWYNFYGYKRTSKIPTFPTNLTAYWPMDNSWNDVVGSYNGTPSGSPTF